MDGPSSTPNGDPLHYVLELMEIHPSVVALIDRVNHPMDPSDVSCLWEVELGQHHLKLCHRDEVIAILIKHPKHLPHILLLLLCHHLGPFVIKGHGAEKGITKGAMDSLKVDEDMAAAPRGDVGSNSGCKLITVCWIMHLYSAHPRGCRSTRCTHVPQECAVLCGPFCMVST